MNKRHTESDILNKKVGKIYLDEQDALPNQSSDIQQVFDLLSLNKNRSINLKNDGRNCVLFLIRGHISVGQEKSSAVFMNENDMVFLPGRMNFLIRALSEVRGVLLFLNDQFSLYEYQGVKDILKYLPDKIGQLNLLEIRWPLRQLLEGVRFYLECNIKGKQLFEIKKQEIFQVFKYFYSKQECAVFYAPLLNMQLEFQDCVLRNCEYVLTVKELADVCNCSVRSFNRKFKEIFHDTPGNWLLKQKNENIERCLKDKTFSIKKIVEEFNFSSQAYFTAYCKKQFGMTPTRYRQILFPEVSEDSADIGEFGDQ